MGSKPYPLYPSQLAPAPEQLATLLGPIGQVDGQDVGDKGRTFALLPGCHLVVLRRDVGEGGTSGAWVTHLPRIVYAFKMRAGHWYSVELKHSASSSSVWRINILAFDRDGGGAATQVPAATTEQQIQDCMQWRPPGSG
jgi:hypothetical protein